MARRLKAFPGQGGRPSYPWPEWTDGGVWEIRPGEDYEVPTEAMRTQLHVKASSLNRKVRTQLTESGLAFQFLLPPEAAAPSGDPDAEHLKAAALYADLINEIYERARTEVKIPRKDGGMQRYAPTRFKQQMDRAWQEGASRLVDAVAKLVRQPTLGLNHLVEAGRPELLAEALVVDRRKPYHDLFPEEAVRRAQARLDHLRRDHPEWHWAWLEDAS